MARRPGRLRRLARPLLRVDYGGVHPRPGAPGRRVELGPRQVERGGGGGSRPRGGGFAHIRREAARHEVALQPVARQLVRDVEPLKAAQVDTHAVAARHELDDRARADVEAAARVRRHDASTTVARGRLPQHEVVPDATVPARRLLRRPEELVRRPVKVSVPEQRVPDCLLPAGDTVRGSQLGDYSSAVQHRVVLHLADEARVRKQRQRPLEPGRRLAEARELEARLRFDDARLVGREQEVRAVDHDEPIRIGKVRCSRGDVAPGDALEAGEVPAEGRRRAANDHAHRHPQLRPLLDLALCLRRT